MLSHRVIFHGRRVCHARKPACGACTLAPICPSYGTGPTDAARPPPSCSRAPAPGNSRPQAGVDPALVPATARGRGGAVKSTASPRLARCALPLLLAGGAAAGPSPSPRADTAGCRSPTAPR